MPAQTAATTFRDSAGSLTLYTFNFTSVANNDTFTAKIPSVVGYWCNSPSATSAASASFVQSTGVFTFTNGATGATTLFVLARD